jgi:uncharacterized membrane protein YbhN (UPF0104 family)
MLGGAALLGGAAWYAGPTRLWEQLRQADPGIFALAAGVALAGTVVSALRWSLIARALGLRAPRARLLAMYARGITANLFLPGALLSGDVLRGLQLSRLGNPLPGAMWSVVLDRASGFWMLCLMSLLAAAGVVVWKAAAGAGPDLPLPQMLAYCTALAVVVALPFVPLFPERLLRRLRLPSGAGRVGPLIRHSGVHSGAVQLLAGAALWLCAQSVGLTLSLPVVLAAAAPIFLMAALPLGVAGFGARELTAVAVLGAAGVPAEQAMAVGMLYGVASVVQGVVAAPLFLARP